MIIQLDLFKLHDPIEDLTPSSWIYVSGKNLNKVVFKLVNDLIVRKGNLQQLIKDIREKNRLLYDEFAHILGVNRTTVKRYEGGKFKPKRDKLNKLKKKFKEPRILELSNKFQTKYKLVKFLMKKLKCSHDLVYKTINRKTEWLSLPIIIELYNLWSTSTNSHEKERRKSETINSIEYVKSAARCKSVIEAVKFLTEDLCKFAGAHAGDGSLGMSLEIFSNGLKELKKAKIKLEKRRIETSKISTSKMFGGYRFSIKGINNDKFRIIVSSLTHLKISLGKSWTITFSEADSNFVEKYRDWVKSCFGISPKMENIGNSFYVRFSNKIISRYLTQIFDFPCGYKATTVRMPEIIKSAPFMYQKAFAIGVSCEAHVSFFGRLVLLTRSKLGVDVGKIIQNGLKFANISFIEERNSTNGFQINRSNKDVYKRLMKYFPEGTRNWHKLKYLAFGFFNTVDNIQEAAQLLDECNGSMVKITEILCIFLKNKNKEFMVKEISNSLANFPSIETVRNYLNLLTRMRILKSRKIRRRNSFIRLYSLEGNLKEWRLPTLLQPSTFTGRAS